MRKILFASLVMLLSPAGPGSASERVACNMKALTKTERATYEKLAQTLLGAVQEQKELRNGYAFRLPPESLMSAAQWVSFERRCCPFFTFELKLARDEGPLWLRVTGSQGVKAFIRAEFGLDPDSFQK